MPATRHLCISSTPSTQSPVAFRSASTIHDVTTVPNGPADLIYCRYLLTHMVW